MNNVVSLIGQNGHINFKSVHKYVMLHQNCKDESEKVPLISCMID